VPDVNAAEVDPGFLKGGFSLIIMPAQFEVKTKEKGHQPSYFRNLPSNTLYHCSPSLTRWLACLLTYLFTRSLTHALPNLMIMMKYKINVK